MDGDGFGAERSRVGRVGAALGAERSREDVAVPSVRVGGSGCESCPWDPHRVARWLEMRPAKRSQKALLWIKALPYAYRTVWGSRLDLVKISRPLNPRQPRQLDPVIGQSY